MIPPHDDRLGAERQIGRLLVVLTYLSVGLLVAGVVALLATGLAPLDGGPSLDLTTLVSELAMLAPAGLLWLGLLTVIATPFSRVALAAYTYGRAGDWSMVGIAVAVMAIVMVGIVAAVTGTV